MKFSPELTRNFIVHKIIPAVVLLLSILVSLLIVQVQAQIEIIKDPHPHWAPFPPAGSVYPKTRGYNYGRGPYRIPIKGIKCFVCDPEGREIGTRGERFSLRGTSFAEKHRNFQTGWIYERDSCVDWYKADNKTRKGYRYKVICHEACIFGDTESVYRGYARYRGKLDEMREINMFGHFKGCWTYNETIQKTALRIDGCMDILAEDEIEEWNFHPTDTDVTVTSKGVGGGHKVCACIKDWCNRGDSLAKPSWLWLFGSVIISLAFVAIISIN